MTDRPDIPDGSRDERLALASSRLAIVSSALPAAEQRELLALVFTWAAAAQTGASPAVAEWWTCLFDLLDVVGPDSLEDLVRGPDDGST